MSGGRAVTRLALRGAWRERRSIVASATFIALAVAIGMLALARQPDHPNPRLMLVVHGKPGAVETGPPAIRSGLAGQFAVTAFGSAYTAVAAHDKLEWRAAGAIAGTSLTVPPGTHVVTYRLSPIRLLAGTRATDGAAADLDPRMSRRDIGIGIAHGHRPEAVDEVAISRGIASLLRVRPGDVVSVVSGPGAGRKLRVTGIAAPRGVEGQAATVLMAPDTLAGATHFRAFEASVPDLDIATASGGSDVNTADWLRGDTLSTYYAGPDAEGLGSLGASIAYVTVLETFVLLLPFLLTSVILAAGMHRRARDLRLLVLAGAGPGALARAAVIRGLVIAAVAAAIAVVMTIAVARIFEMNIAFGPLVLLGPLVPALVACIAASLEAARFARRMGSEGSTEPPLRRSLRLGGAAIGIALLVPAVAAVIPNASRFAIIGPVAALLAVRFLAPIAVWLPSHLPLSRAARAASRSVARARWVSAPAASGVALASVLGLVVLISGTSGTYSSSHVPRRDTVAVQPSALANSSGAAIAPESLVRQLVPDAVEAVPIWPIDPCIDCGVFAIRPADAAALGIRAARPGADTTPAIATDSDPHWPALLPSMFVAASTAPAGAPSWLIRLPHDLSIAEERSLSRRTSAEGLKLASGDRDPFETNGLTTRGQLAITAITTFLALLFGASATVVVLAERRETSRRLLLAGARPRDCRLAAAFAAFSVGAGAVLLSALLIGLIAVEAALAGVLGGNALLGLATAFLGLLTVPVVLALGAGLLWRPPRSLASAGRVVRDASVALG